MTGTETTPFDLQKTGEQLREYLQLEAHCQAASTRALQEKAAAQLKAGELLTEVAKDHPGHFDEVCEIAGLAKTRVYDLMRAAKGGRKALEDMQEANRKRQQKYRDRKKARAKPVKAAKAEPKPDSVTRSHVTESPRTQPAGNVLEAAAEARKVECAGEQGESPAAPAAKAEPKPDSVTSTPTTESPPTQPGGDGLKAASEAPKLMAQQDGPAAQAPPEPAAGPEAPVVELGLKIEPGRSYMVTMPDTAGNKDCAELTQALGNLRTKFSFQITLTTESEKEHTKPVAGVRSSARPPVIPLPRLIPRFTSAGMPPK
jgi:hypothetical protein